MGETASTSKREPEVKANFVHLDEAFKISTQIYIHMYIFRQIYIYTRKHFRRTTNTRTPRRQKREWQQHLRRMTAHTAYAAWLVMMM